MSRERNKVLISDAKILLIPSTHRQKPSAVRQELDVLPADVLIEGDVISRISVEPIPRDTADVVVAAHANFLLPEIIDPHTLIGDLGFPEREDFTSGTEAAVAGGLGGSLCHVSGNGSVKELFGCRVDRE